MLSEVQIAVLIAQAVHARENAYAPYSGFKVGAIAIDELDRVFPGCNVENGSYGLSLCAERTAIAMAIAHGARSIRAILLVSQTNPPSTPCGACLQWMSELATPEMEIIASSLSGEYQRFNLSELLGSPFRLRKSR